MRIFGALVWREIVERRLLLLASLLLGFVPIVLPWLPGLSTKFSPAEVRSATAIGLAALFGGASLAMLGSTIVGRDLSEKRLGFYFSRPISSWALWLSRITAALILVLVSVLLMVAPTSAADAGSWADAISGQQGSERAWPILDLGERFRLMYFADQRPLYAATPERLSPTLLFVLGVLLILLLLTLTHAVSTMIRGRSIWVLADLAGLSVFLAISWAARGVLVREQALGALVWAERLLVPSVLTALVVAGGVQLAFGRIDLLRGHRYLSVTLWPLLIFVASSFGLYSQWVASSTIRDLKSSTHFQAGPGERWMMVGGPVRHRAGARAAFLLEADSGRSWRLGNLSVSRAWLVFSPDGGAVAWGRCESFIPPACELWAKDLRDAESPPRPIGVPIHLSKMRWPSQGDPAALTFNDDGSLLAVAEEDTLIVYDVGHISGGTEPSSARVLAAVNAKLPEAVTFLPERKIRFHHHTSSPPEIAGFGSRTEIRTLDLETHQLITAGGLPAGHLGARSPERDMLFFQQLPPKGLWLHDGESGLPLAEIETPWKSGWGHFLQDGRLIVGHYDRGDLTLLVLSPEGQELHQIERTGVRRRHVGGELSPGRLLIGLKEEPPSAQVAPHELDVEPLLGWTTYVLDADAGELSPLAAGVMPLESSGVATERIFLGEGNDVIRWNPETGESRKVLPLD